MRVSTAATVLLIWALPAIAASPTPQISPEDAHAGCMHTDLRPCMISLGLALWFDMKIVAPEIARRNELDVNGNTAHRKIYIDAAVPGQHHEPIAIVLTLASPAPNDLVVRVEVTLPEDPELAHTASEYDRTLLYDVVSVLLGRRCPKLDKLTLYRFYENSLKPREVSKTEVRKNGISSRTTVTAETEKVPFCGVMFSLHRQLEWDGPPDFPGKSKGGVTSIAIE